MPRFRDPSWSDVILAAIGSRMDNVYTAMPGAVQEYDASRQAVSVQPLVQRSFISEDDTREVERMPVIQDVPVVFPSGGKFRITFPVKAGDTGLIIVASCSLDKWLSIGGEVDPENDRRHHPGDAIFIPGLRHFGNGGPLTSAPTTMMTMGSDVGPVIEIDDDEIRVGGAGADKTLLATPWFQALGPLMTALAAVPTGWATDVSVSAPFTATTTAMAALITAINTFTAAWSGVVTTIGKVK